MIQETLLKNDPRLKGAQFTIELNKRLFVGNARHEVDVYVVTQPGTRYESVVLFECKDWKKAVSKNEIMLLNEKVALFGATRGVLVAPRISKDAAGILSQYERIQYRKCSDDIKGLLGIDVVHSAHDPLKVTARITRRNPDEHFPADYLNSLCYWGSQAATFETFAHRWVQEIANQDKLLQKQRYASESAHWYQTRWRIDFLLREFTLGGVDVAALELEVTFFVTVVISAPRYKCSIDGDGQFVSFEIIHPDFPNRSMELNIVLAG